MAEKKRIDRMMKILMEKEMQKLLYSTGVFRHYKGYDYFVRAVHLVHEKPERLHYIYKEIYLVIADEVGKDVRAIERDVRTIRDVFFRNGGSELLSEMSGVNAWSKKRPSPGEMIEIFAMYLQK